MEIIPTAEEILVKNSVFKEPEISNFNLIIHRDCYMMAQRNIKAAMIEFAKEAIIADRINLLNHAVSIAEGDSIVDKDSIINAPNIEL